MKNQSKNGETLIETIPCESDMERVTTVDKKRILKVIAYATMGDGGVYIRKGASNATFIMNQTADHEDLLLEIKKCIDTFTSSIINDSNCIHTNGCTRKSLKRLYTRQHPFFTKLHDQIYTDKYKRVSEHYLKLLDAEALAIMYMCDGSLYIDKAEKSKKGLINDSYSVSLHLKRLSEGDILLVKKYLKKKLDLEWNVNKQGKYRYLRLRNKDLTKFMNLIKPYVVKSFEYKIIRTIGPNKVLGDDTV